MTTPSIESPIGTGSVLDSDPAALLAPLDTFARRHLGPSGLDLERMLEVLGVPSLDALIDETVPANIRLAKPLQLDSPRSESQALADLRAIAAGNQIYRSLIGMGYYDTLVPGVIQRNILENPGWYTQYTPYQAEIAQGRLEALLNYQTMVADLTGMDIANASLLDEGTAAAEAMTMCKRGQKRGHNGNTFFVSDKCHPQTIDVVRTRAEPLGFTVVVGDAQGYDFAGAFGALVQYPDTEGSIDAWDGFCARAHAAGALVVVATDLLALTLLRPPGEFGADIAIGNASALACRLALAARTLPLWPPATNSSASCPAGWSAYRRTRRGSRPCVFRCRRASSTSAARRRPATSARRRCCWP